MTGPLFDLAKDGTSVSSLAAEPVGSPVADFALPVDAPLDLTFGQVDEALPGTETQPWGVELADGAKCVRRRGGSWPGRADGLAGAYSCDRENEFVLAGDGPLVNRAKPAWTVKSVG